MALSFVSPLTSSLSVELTEFMMHSSLLIISSTIRLISGNLPVTKNRVDCSLLDEQVGEQENFNCREKGTSDSYALKELSVQSVCGKVNVLSGKS